jgi:acyl-CoA-binding protein
MPGIVTRRFRIHNAEQFHEAFSETAATNMYIFISRVSAWDDDNNPPTPTDTIQNTEYDAWRRMIAAKIQLDDW